MSPLEAILLGSGVAWLLPPLVLVVLYTYEVCRRKLVSAYLRWRGWAEHRALRKRALAVASGPALGSAAGEPPRRANGSQPAPVAREVPCRTQLAPVAGHVEVPSTYDDTEEPSAQRWTLCLQ